MSYQPSVHAAVGDNTQYKYSQLPLTGATRQDGISRTRNFVQAGEFYRSLTKQQQANLVSNMAATLGPHRQRELSG